MISADQIRAWLTTAFGNLLTGIALTPIVDDQNRQLLVQAVKNRVSAINLLPSDGVMDESIIDYGCSRLYNTHMTLDGLEGSVVRQGQDADWQHHWSWLSVPQDAHAMKATLQLVGRLLINSPLLIGLTSTIRNGNDNSQKRALCVIRRWLLTAKVVAWLFSHFNTTGLLSGLVISLALPLAPYLRYGLAERLLSPPVRRGETSPEHA